MGEMRIIIAGSRSFNDFQLLADSVINVISEIKVEDKQSIRIISGGARGADTLGERFAKLAHLELSIFPADWDKLGKRARYVRNEIMVKFACAGDGKGVLVAFWDGESKGTKHTIDLACKFGLDVHVIRFSNLDYYTTIPTEN